jgi:bifunctional DNA-binding transcriptional regulator/antitoxin component of YhaV-PrlF toxin-antitoxin module
MSDAATTTLSSKGQVVIPEAIRERLGLKMGPSSWWWPIAMSSF